MGGLLEKSEGDRCMNRSSRDGLQALHMPHHLREGGRQLEGASTALPVALPKMSGRGACGTSGMQPRSSNGLLDWRPRRLGVSLSREQCRDESEKRGLSFAPADNAGRMGESEPPLLPYLTVSSPSTRSTVD